MKKILQKYIAQTGYCSRRQAEEMVKKSVGSKKPHILVNGSAPVIGMLVDDKDEIKINGKVLQLQKEKIYIKLNKPAGYTCTTRNFKDEKNVFDLFAHSVETRHASSLQNAQNLIIAGRLDKNSRGLVILTNDGEWVQKITHPKFEHEKKYIITIKNYELKITKNLESIFKKGIDIEEGDGVVKAKSAKYLGDNKFEIILTEGKKRQIRRMFKVLGYEVIDLLRTAIGNIELGNLGEGKWEYFKITK